MVTRRIRTILSRLRKRNEGQALVEFALIAPIFILLVLGVVEFGRAWNVKQTLTDAVREGCRTAVVAKSGTTLNTVANSMNAYMVAASLDTASATKSVSDCNATGCRLTGTGAPSTCSITYPYQLRWIQGLMGWTGAQAAFNMYTEVTFRNE